MISSIYCKSASLFYHLQVDSKSKHTWRKKTINETQTGLIETVKENNMQE